MEVIGSNPIAPTINQLTLQELLFSTVFASSWVVSTDFFLGFKTAPDCSEYSARITSTRALKRTIVVEVSMDLADYLRRQFAYNAWANREVLSAIGGAESHPQLVTLMAHILSAEGLWLERLKGEPQSTPVWPESDFNQCRSRAAELAGMWDAYLRPMSSHLLLQVVSYRNSKGEPWSNTVQDVLTHAVMHSAYHRGQIASQMRATGQTPAYTDFIHAVRQGCIE